MMNDRVFKHFGVYPNDPLWDDWHWQYRHRITDVDTLAEITTLSEQEKQEIEICLGNYSMAITPYYASLMSVDDSSCPIRMQSVPSIKEQIVHEGEMVDPLAEEASSPVPNIVHRYPDRVLFLVSHQCAVYCRHCIRKVRVGDEGFLLSEQEINRGVEYIAATPAIRDVLISGGDPLALGDDYLESILQKLFAIDHVEIIRIGTRIPVVMPMRITESLLDMLKKYHPLWINTQFNHPNELSHQAVAACNAIVDAGIPLSNQSVLLRNINDDYETMKSLLLGLVKARVRPYYLYQCDLNEGIGHFRTKVDVGIKLIESLTGNITGFAIPKFVIDAPGGGGKIPINPDFIASRTECEMVMRNYQGNLYRYIEYLTE
ncbi:MAG: KamA family radical SAM protein [Oscillospiraceae bacterium]|nr:KamA family radical SAM protein [Oscillospiraceae bacterium]